MPQAESHHTRNPSQSAVTTEDLELAAQLRPLIEGDVVDREILFAALSPDPMETVRVTARRFCENMHLEGAAWDAWWAGFKDTMERENQRVIKVRAILAKRAAR